MNTTFLKSAFILISAGILFTSCKKDKEETEVESNDQATASTDETRVSENSDEAADDAINMFSASSLKGARIGLTNVCGATIDSSNLAGNKTITLTFDGTTACVNNTRKRSGSITAQLTTGNKWSDDDAVLTITFNNYKVTRISDSKSVTFNGTKTITNVNGGLIAQIPGTISAVTHRIQSTTMSITFDDGTQRTWSTDRTRVITKSGSDYLATISGNGSSGGYSNLAFWGTTRFGGAFYTEVSTPVKVSTCSTQGRALIIEGVKVHHGALRDITVTFGVTSSGVADGTCSSYGYKVNWTSLKGESKQVIVSY